MVRRRRRRPIWSRVRCGGLTRTDSDCAWNEQMTNEGVAFDVTVRLVPVHQSLTTIYCRSAPAACGPTERARRNFSATPATHRRRRRSAAALAAVATGVDRRLQSSKGDSLGRSARTDVASFARTVHKVEQASTSTTINGRRVGWCSQMMPTNGHGWSAPAAALPGFHRRHRSSPAARRPARPLARAARAASRAVSSDRQDVRHHCVDCPHFSSAQKNL